MRKTKIAAIAAVSAALVAGCGGGGTHPGVTHASAGTAPGRGAAQDPATAQDPGTSGAPAGLAVTAACARFRSATIVMFEHGPSDRKALRRYGRAMRHLGGELGDAGSGPQRVLGNALVLVGAHALGTAAGQPPKGLVAAYDGVKRAAATADAACPSAGK